MASFHFVSALLVSGALLAPTAFASRVHQAPTSGQHHSSSSHKSGAKSATKSSAKSSVKSSLKSDAKAKSDAKTTTSGKAARTRGKKLHGQQAIDPERVTQIQQALIREHYLTGDATGSWDATTVAAMQKFQADQGWQTKLMPDSRALKKLGLGPDYSNAINAQGSSFVDSSAKGSITPEQAAAFAEAAGVHQ